MTVIESLGNVQYRNLSVPDPLGMVGRLAPRWACHNSILGVLPDPGVNLVANAILAIPFGF